PAVESPTADPRPSIAPSWLLPEHRTHTRFAALAGNGGSRSPVPSTPAGPQLADAVQQCRASIADAAEKPLRASQQCSTGNHAVVTKPIFSLLDDIEGSNRTPPNASQL